MNDNIDWRVLLCHRGIKQTHKEDKRRHLKNMHTWFLYEVIKMQDKMEFLNPQIHPLGDHCQWIKDFLRDDFDRLVVGH